MPFVTSARLHVIHNVAISNGRKTLQQRAMMLDKDFPAHNQVNFPFVKFDMYNYIFTPLYGQHKWLYVFLGFYIELYNIYTV